MSSKTIHPRDNFSVALGLTDFGNPILYTITSITVWTHLYMIMPGMGSRVVYLIGVILSLIFGFGIPTVKLLVGLGKIQFQLPVKFVFAVNFGIFLSGLMLWKNLFAVSTPIFILVVSAAAALLGFIYWKSGKFNPIAVLTGGVGYMLIYISLIHLALMQGRTISIVLYGIAIVLYLMLIGIGIKADLKDARVHWVIEISNIVCQACVALGTLFVFGVL